MNFYILAGGKSRRFGSNKAFFVIDGKIVIERVIAAIPPNHAIFIITNSAAEYAPLNLPTLSDNFPDAGPLAGIQAGLVHSSYEWNFFLASDFPCLQRNSIDEICLRLFLNKNEGEMEKIQVILPMTKDGPQPLCALWSKSALPFIAAALQSKNLSVRQLLNKLSLQYITPSNPEVLFNLNTPGDLLLLQNCIDSK
jgi:molybdopterin-guanine dinucleotide biosynthesis protein A